MTEFAIHEAKLTGAFTDLAMGIIVIPLLIILCLTKSDNVRAKCWNIVFFSTLGASCFIGYAAHYYFTEEFPNIVVWAVLYPLMYEVFAAFFLSALFLSSDGVYLSKKHVIIVHLICLVPYLTSTLLRFPYDGNSIRILVCFGAALSVTGFVLIGRKSFTKNRLGGKIMLTSLLVLLPAVYFQINRTAMIRVIWYFDYNGITHLLIILGIIVLFIGDLLLLKRKNA